MSSNLTAVVFCCDMPLHKGLNVRFAGLLGIERSVPPPWYTAGMLPGIRPHPKKIVMDESSKNHIYRRKIEIG